MYTLKIIAKFFGNKNTKNILRSPLDSLTSPSTIKKIICQKKLRPSSYFNYLQSNVHAICFVFSLKLNVL
jgi:hypothetical protein